MTCSIGSTWPGVPGGSQTRERCAVSSWRILTLPADVGDLMPDEPDHSVFHEIACLFQDTADFVAYGTTLAFQVARQRTA